MKYYVTLNKGSFRLSEANREKEIVFIEKISAGANLVEIYELAKERKIKTIVADVHDSEAEQYLIDHGFSVSIDASRFVRILFKKI